MNKNTNIDVKRVKSAINQTLPSLNHIKEHLKRDIKQHVDRIVKCCSSVKNKDYNVRKEFINPIIDVTSDPIKFANELENAAKIIEYLKYIGNNELLTDIFEMAGIKSIEIEPCHINNLLSKNPTLKDNKQKISKLFDEIANVSNEVTFHTSKIKDIYDDIPGDVRKSKNNPAGLKMSSFMTLASHVTALDIKRENEKLNDKIKIEEISADILKTYVNTIIK